MEIHFKTTLHAESKNELSKNPTRFAERKLRSLQKYLNGSSDDAQAFVEFGKSSEAHLNGEIWRVHIKLDSQGQRFHATATGEQLQGAISTAVKELETEMRKTKQRARRMVRRGGNALKALMRGFVG
jgi:ribosomal subunit interface protein